MACVQNIARRVEAFRHDIASATTDSSGNKRSALHFTNADIAVTMNIEYRKGKKCMP